MRRVLLSFFALFGVVLGTLLMYNHWQNQENLSSPNEIVPFNQSITINNLSVPEGKNLVPVGAVLQENSVDYVSYEYLVKSNEINNVKVNLENVRVINNDTTYDGEEYIYSNYDVIQVSESYSKITINIYMKMPETKSDYLIVANSAIDFDLNLKIE